MKTYESFLDIFKNKNNKINQAIFDELKKYDLDILFYSKIDSDYFNPRLLINYPNIDFFLNSSENEYPTWLSY